MVTRPVLAAALALSALPAVQGYDAYGDYQSVSDVLEHAQMTTDVKMFDEALKGTPDYTLAKGIYTDGGGTSCKSSVQPRTLQAFATADLTGETYHDAWVSQSEYAVGFWNDMMLAALDGTGAFSGLSDTKRAVTLRKAVLGLMTYYAAHELESAIDKAADATKRSAAVSGHAWDEGWVFYYGLDGSGSAWEVAGKRDNDFPAGTKIQEQIVKQFNQGLVYVLPDAYSMTGAETARDTIYRMWAVTYIRAGLKYLELSEHTYNEIAHAEGYAYYHAIHGWLKSKGGNAAIAADAMKAALDITLTAIPSGTFCDVKAKVDAALEELKYDCDTIGTYKSQTTVGAACAACSVQATAMWADGANAVADPSGTEEDKMCTGYEPPAAGAQRMAQMGVTVTALASSLAAWAA